MGVGVCGGLRGQNSQDTDMAPSSGRRRLLTVAAWDTRGHQASSSVRVPGKAEGRGVRDTRRCGFELPWCLSSS